MFKQLFFTVETVLVNDVIFELALFACDEFLDLNFTWRNVVELLFEDMMTDFALDGIGGVSEGACGTRKVFVVIVFELDLDIGVFLLFFACIAQESFSVGVKLFSTENTLRISQHECNIIQEVK